MNLVAMQQELHSKLILFGSAVNDIGHLIASVVLEYVNIFCGFFYFS